MVVYKGYDPDRQQTVLLKVLTKDAVQDDSIVRWFEHEVQTVASVDHPNVVELLESGVFDGRPFLVTEFVEGHSLEEIVRRFGAIPPELSAFIVRECAKGVSAAHKLGVVHRDLKPPNILVGFDGNVKLADFGLASQVGETDDVRGTPGYLAPEVIAGQPHTEASDLFALGVVLAELLTGRILYSSDTASGAINDTINGDPLTALSADLRIPESLRGVLEALLDHDPAARLLSSEELFDQLSGILAGYGIGAPVGSEHLAAFIADPGSYKPISSVALASSTDDSSLVQEARPPLQTHGFRLRPVHWVGMVALTLIVGFAFVTSGLLDRSTSRDQPQTLVADTLLASTDAPNSGVEEGEETRGAQDELPAEPDELQEEPDDTALEVQPDSQSLPIAVPESIPEAREETQMGQLSVSVNPWAEVFVDGERVGQTPLREALSIPSGEHELALRNPDFPPITRTVHVAPGQMTNFAVSLWDHVARVRFDIFPYAEVRVDGNSIGTLPPQRTPLILNPGRHTIQLTHPTLGTWTDQFSVRAGESRKIRYKLDELLSEGSP